MATLYGGGVRTGRTFSECSRWLQGLQWVLGVRGLHVGLLFVCRSMCTALGRSTGGGGSSLTLRAVVCAFFRALSRDFDG